MLLLTEARRDPATQALHLTWNDGHRGHVSYHELRGWCPCAGCQGHTSDLVFHPPSAAVEPRQIAAVGNYAISITWSDGHGTGIYRFDYLRDLCGCAACAAQGGEPRPGRFAAG
jgi:DUF971 family protein